MGRNAALTASACLGLGIWDCAAQQDITLEQAIGYAVKQNRELKLIRLSSESRKLAVSDAASDFMLNIQPEAGAETADGRDTLRSAITATRKTEFGASALLRAEVARTDSDDGPGIYRDTVLVEIQQPLLRRFGGLVNREPLTSAESRVVAACREIELRKTDLTVQVAGTHEDLFKLQRQIESERRTVERLDRFARLTQAREKQGRATRVDSLRAELKLGKARLLLSGLNDRLTSVRGDFAELLGFSPEAEFAAVPGPRPVVKVPDQEAAVRIALSNRLDYAQILQDRDDASRGVRIARRNLLPDLNLIARYERAGDGATFSDAARLDGSVWFVGLTMSSDLSMRREHTALDQAQIGHDMAQIRIDAVKAGIMRQVQQAISTYKRTQEEISMAEQNHKLARNRVRLARHLFERGKGDSFSVSDAEDELLAAETQWLDAQSSAAVAAYQLLRVLGRLIEYPEELRPGRVNP